MASGGNFMSGLPTSCSAGLLLFLLSPCCIIYGCGEWRLGHGVSAEPVTADLAQLERGRNPPDNHISLGPHVACYYAGVYRYLTDRDLPRDPTPDTSVTDYYYPIFSESDPNVVEIDRLLQKYGTLDEVPDDVPIPAISNFRVLVKTDRYEDVKSLPSTVLQREPSLTGLVINRFVHLDGDTMEYIRDNFPTIDFETILIIEEGRRPSSMWFAQGVTYCATFAWMMGILFCFVGLIQWILRGVSPKSPPPNLPPTPNYDLNAPPPSQKPGDLPPIRKPPEV